MNSFKTSRPKRTKILTCILPAYAFIFAIYATFGSSEHREIRLKRDQMLKGNIESYSQWNNEFHRHLLSTEQQNCTPAAIDEFPEDFFTQEERARGGVIIHFLISCYLFYALAIICDEYFVPSLECICETLNIPTDVAGATFMAMGTSAPELFTSVIGVFVTEGDIGIGTIVGSAVFNILAVLTVCGLFAGVVVELDWWPLTRDSIGYIITVITLIAVITDQIVTWYEAVIMLVLYALYILAMYFNSSLEKFANKIVNKCCKRSKYMIESAHDESSSLLDARRESETSLAYGKNGAIGKVDEDYTVPIKDLEDFENEDEGSIWSMPYHGAWKQISWVIMWPALFVFHFTIPNCRKKSWKSWFMLTFIMSILYIGSLSYITTWMVTIIGYTLGVPDTVMGLTFLAAGTSVPEVISSLIVTKQGLGNMAVSNILGSNVFDILFCLGFPWILKTLAFSADKTVTINSGGIEYSAISLLSTVVFLFSVVILNKWRLNKKLGAACCIMYICFLIVSNLFELNVFGMVNLPTCLEIA
ncbi:hypothetical protein CHUAL_007269 [Chamberlinius hualienensis]